MFVCSDFWLAPMSSLHLSVITTHRMLRTKGVKNPDPWYIPQGVANCLRLQGDPLVSQDTITGLPILLCEWDLRLVRRPVETCTEEVWWWREQLWSWLQSSSPVFTLCSQIFNVWATGPEAPDKLASPSMREQLHKVMWKQRDLVIVFEPYITVKQVKNLNWTKTGVGPSHVQG